ncbi:MAG: hypothetical protein SCK29_13115 [Bacillota bacterium]|nr:hypothetical protein [Bacillota bacterium]MDW7685041.1 hypothetical protein [Bacillota bacterium]
MEWIKLRTAFDSEEKALKAAGIVATTEARLNSEPHGPQYDVETRIEKAEEKFHVYWRKVFAGYDTGCGGGCGSCGEEKTPPAQTGKVIPFKKPRT